MKTRRSYLGAAARKRSTTVLDRCAPASSAIDAADMTPITPANTQVRGPQPSSLRAGDERLGCEHSVIVPWRAGSANEVCSRLSRVVAPGADVDRRAVPFGHVTRSSTFAMWRGRVRSTSPSSSGRPRSRSARCAPADPTWWSCAGGSWNVTPRSACCGGSALGCSPHPSRAGWRGRSPTRSLLTRPPSVIAAALPDDATVVTIGWPAVAGAALMRRGDARVLCADSRHEASAFLRMLERADIECDPVPAESLAPRRGRRRSGADRRHCCLPAPRAWRRSGRTCWPPSPPISTRPCGARSASDDGCRASMSMPSPTVPSPASNRSTPTSTSCRSGCSGMSLRCRVSAPISRRPAA